MSMACCGRIASSRSVVGHRVAGLARRRCCWSHSRRVARASTSCVDCARGTIASVLIGMWAGLFLLSSEASMSTWTILPCLANSLELAGDAVVEPNAEREQQVGLVDRRSWRRPSRACRACRATGSGRSGTMPSPCRRHRDRDAGLVGELAEVLGARSRRSTPPPQ